jgi:ribulose-5-phosphate 4-epimerase/fuculose-1-phosphate aldolase
MPEHVLGRDRLAMQADEAHSTGKSMKVTSSESRLRPTVEVPTHQHIYHRPDVNSVDSHER